MHRCLRLFGAFFLFVFAASAGIYAEDPPLSEILPELRNRALVMNINVRVLEKNHVVVWNESNQRIAISGTPVHVRLEGDNLIIALQLTPFLRREGGDILVAQGQVWIDVPGEGMRLHTSIQSIPMTLGEPIYFFPLGPARPQDSASIEIILTLTPYRETETPASTNRRNDR